MKLLSIFVIILIISSALGLRRVKRLIGGYMAKGNSFPYQIGIRVFLVNKEFPTWCGGSIINHEWILTAAHCVQSATHVEILMGSTKISEAPLTHRADKDKIILHPNWMENNMTNDIALIKMPYTEYSPQIQPVKLPSNKSYEGTFYIASGWGDTKDLENVIHDDLKWAEFKILGLDECTKKYPTTVSSTNICLDTSKGDSTCGGDSGGPLVLKDSYVLVGVSSFVSQGGCSNGYPAVFTRVISYMDWIKSHIGK